MFNLAVLALFLSFALAVISLRREKGERELDHYKSELNKTKIKGTIVLDKEKEAKHYSSYS